MKTSQKCQGLNEECSLTVSFDTIDSVRLCSDCLNGFQSANVTNSSITSITNNSLNSKHQIGDQTLNYFSRLLIGWRAQWPGLETFATPDAMLLFADASEALFRCLIQCLIQVLSITKVIHNLAIYLIDWLLIICPRFRWFIGFESRTGQWRSPMTHESLLETNRITVVI